MKNLTFAALLYFALGAVVTIAAQTTWSWTVPEGVDKIQVTSVRGDNTVLNTTFRVEPGQTFKLEVVK